jgi:choice-of-anchor A domain-containing protein
MVMKVAFALLAVFALSVEASLIEYVQQLQQPPVCDMCVRLFTEIAAMPVVSEQQTRAGQVCNAFPSHALADPAFSGNCADPAVLIGDITPVEHCSKLAVCPTECAYCESRVVTNLYSAWDSDNNTLDFCQHQFSKYGSDQNECIRRVGEYSESAPYPSSETDNVREAFCSHPSAPCSDYGIENWSYSTGLKNCLDAPISLQCVNGALDIEFGEKCTVVDAVDPATKEFTGAKENLCFEDPCQRHVSCDCSYGYIQSGGNCVPDPNAGVVPSRYGGGSMVEEEALSVADIHSISQVHALRSRNTQNLRYSQTVSVRHQVMFAQQLHREQMEAARAASASNCANDEWVYFTDSPVDGITYTFVGDVSDHEYYCMAVRQNLDEITFAINLNLWPEGQSMSPTVTVSMGDWFMNPANADGTFTDIPTAMDQNKLYAIHMDVTNDNPDPLGVYSHAKFHSVAGTNNGFSTVSAYMSEIENMNSVNNPTAGVLLFGGGIDEYANDGLGYLGDAPLNELIPGASRFVDGLAGDVEYYIHMDLSYPLDAADWERVTQDYSLTWIAMGGTGINTRIFRIRRDSLPPNANTYLVHVAAECFNEVIAGQVFVCEIPSVSPSPTRTPTRTPSRTPSVSPSSSATSSASATRTSSVSATGTPAPSLPQMNDCMCFDWAGEDHPGPGINTLVLGDLDMRSSDTEGRLFVCGDANLDDYSVGDKLDEDDSRDDLFVKGTVNFQSGRVHTGNIVYGDSSSVFGTSIMHGMYNRTILSNPDRYDCVGATSHFRAMSLRIGALESTGESHITDDGTLMFTRLTVNAAEVWDVDCADLSKVNKMEWHSVPDAQSVIVNFVGEECSFKDLNILPVDPAKVVFNFPMATKIDIKTSALSLNVLAPSATINGRGALISGQTVAFNFEGNMQQNWNPCLACLGGYQGVVLAEKSNDQAVLSF